MERTTGLYEKYASFPIITKCYQILHGEIENINFHFKKSLSQQFSLKNWNFQSFFNKQILWTGCFINILFSR